jgi:hypothetical protein
MAKRHSKRRNSKKMRKSRKMRGGDFSQQETTLLRNQGFKEGQIQTLRNMELSYNQINTKIKQLMNNDDFHGNRTNMTDRVVDEFIEEQSFNMNTSIQNDPTDLHDMDLDDDNSFHLSDLENNSQDSGYTTTDEDISFGGKKRKTLRKRKGRKSRKTKKRKQRGGMCFGKGVGANNFDPNYSIYNTRELGLFPYNPSK